MNAWKRNALKIEGMDNDTRSILSPNDPSSADTQGQDQGHPIIDEPWASGQRKRYLATLHPPQQVL